MEEETAKKIEETAVGQQYSPIPYLEKIVQSTEETAGNTEAIMRGFVKLFKIIGSQSFTTQPKYTGSAEEIDMALRGVAKPAQPKVYASHQPQVPQKLFDTLRDKESITFLRINKGFSLTSRGFTQTPGWWTCINPECNIMRDHMDVCPGCQWDKDIINSIKKAFKKKVEKPKPAKSTRIAGPYDHLFDGPGQPGGDEDDD